MSLAAKSNRTTCLRPLAHADLPSSTPAAWGVYYGRCSMGTKLRKTDCWHIVRRVFPDYKGRKFRLEITGRVHMYNTNWGGGSRNYYGAVRADGVSRAWLNMPAPWRNPVEGESFELRPDVVVVEHSYFCGRDSGITLYVHPQAGVSDGTSLCALPALLPA